VGRRRYYKRPMSNEQLPQYVDATRLSQQQVELTGQMLLRDLPRVSEALMVPEAETVNYSFKFTTWEKERVIRAHVVAKAPLQCERCGKRFLYEIEAKTDFGVVPDYLSLPSEGLEPVVAEAHLIDLWALLEEELVLNIPYIPKHERQDCGQNVAKAQRSQDEMTPKVQPFAKLAALLSRDRITVP